MLNNWNFNGDDYSFEFADIDDLVAQMNAIDPSGNWIHNDMMLLIVGGTPGSNYSNMDVTAIANGLPSTIGLNFGLNPQGTQLSFEAGEYEVIFTETATNCMDTVLVEIICFTGTTSQTITNTISADENPYVVCIDTTELPGNIVSIFNACPDDAEGFVNYLIDEDEYCVKYQGVKCNGMDRACIVVCDDLGLCDTTFFEITVDNTLCDLAPTFYQEEILINFTETFCVDTTELPGMVVNMQNVCANIGNVDFDLNLNDFCVTYTGENIGKDSACIVLTDQYGNQDTTFFCINVIPPAPETIQDTIFYGETMDFCIETNELAGQNILIFNDCENLSGQSLNFGINDVTLCVEANGIGLGTEQACIIICDEFGICDTTNLIITVEDNGDPCALNPPPTALDDTAETLQNDAINIRILDNDNIPDCSPSTFEIIDSPADGTIIINPDGQSIDYLPAQDYCGMAEFTYELCNDNGCSNAKVQVAVNCIPSNEIKIHTAFSPNGDGINDFFNIENIENFPQSDLIIVNRWGNTVFKDLAYDNSWDGSYRNQMLPDGTYFYILDLDGERRFSGYVQIQK